MNFADILEQWENRQTAGRKTNAAARQHLRKNTAVKPETTRINPTELWLRRYGTVDKDAEYERSEEKSRLTNAASAKKMPIEAQLDLHGLTREEAYLRLDAFITECVRRNVKKVLIVHGKGNHSAEQPVLKSAVRSFIEADKRLGASGHPAGANGGQGATWVIIRTNLL